MNESTINNFKKFKLQIESDCKKIKYQSYKILWVRHCESCTNEIEFMFPVSLMDFCCAASMGTIIKKREKKRFKEKSILFPNAFPTLLLLLTIWNLTRIFTISRRKDGEYKNQRSPPFCDAK